MVARLFLFSNINKQMKLRLFLLLMSVATLSAYADDARIVIKQKSGNETVLDLATDPVITFSGEDMVITSSLTTITIPLDDVDSYEAYDEVTGICPLTDAPQFSNGHVVFSGLAGGAEARVYSADGRLMSRHAADTSGYVAVSLDSLPKGTYVISTPNQTIKINNK